MASVFGLNLTRVETYERGDSPLRCEFVFDVCDGHREQFIAAVTEAFTSQQVDVADARPHVDQEKSIGTVFQQGVVAGFTFSQRLLRLAQLGDVGKGDDDGFNLTRRVE